MRRSFLGEVYWRNPLLTLVGWLHVVLLLATVVGYATDDRLVLGVNTWLKPMKFMGSIALYVWTIAWFSKYIRRPRWLLSTVSIVIAASMVIESSCILLQAARGTTSHFNTATDFDAALFRTMGIMIGINMFMAFVVLLMFGRRIRLHPSYLWGIRAGLVVFMSGSVIGGIMVAHGAHTFGAPDGGPGVMFFNWSTVAGDLRIAHGLAIHALQLLPLAGYAISCWSAVQRTVTKMTLLAIVVFAYAGAVFTLYQQAVAGEPFM